MYELAPWFDECPISENDRLKIGKTNARQLFDLEPRAPKRAIATAGETAAVASSARAP